MGAKDFTPRKSRGQENFEVDTRRTGSDHDSGLSSPTMSESMELDDMLSEAGDEEAGLTAKERRRNTPQRFHSHDIRDVPISKYDKKEADRNVIKKLTANAGLIGLWYLFATSISVYNKWMFAPDRLNFHYPLFTTSLHMLVQFLLAGLVLFFIPRLRPSKSKPNRSSSSNTLSQSSSKPLVTVQFYFTRLLPCGVATALDVGLGNTSLKFISLTFLTMCKSSALAFVLLFAFVFRLETPSWKLILIIATMTGGVIMMVAGETAFNAKGFALIISSAFFSGFRWALTQILLLKHPATANPFATQFFIAPIEFVCLVLIACFAEGPISLVHGIGDLAAKEGVFQGICLLIFPGVLAFCMISAEFALLQRTSVVTLSICGIFKEVVTISAAELVYHDPLTPINISGLLVTIASIGAYNYLKITKMRQEAREKLITSDGPGEPGEDEERQNLVGRSPDGGGESSRRADSPNGSSRSLSPPKRQQDLE